MNMVNNSVKNSWQKGDLLFNEFNPSWNLKYSSRGLLLATLSYIPFFLYPTFTTLGTELQLISSFFHIIQRYHDTTQQTKPHEQQHTAPAGVFDYLRYIMARVYLRKSNELFTLVKHWYQSTSLVLIHNLFSRRGYYRGSSRVNRFWIVRFYQRLTCDKRLWWILPSNFGTLR